MAQERDFSFSVYPVKFPDDSTSVPRKVHAPNGMKTGTVIYVDIGSASTEVVVFGQSIGPLPNWIECEIEAHVSAEILVKRLGT